MTLTEITEMIAAYNEKRGRAAFLRVEIAAKTRELERLIALQPVYEAGPGAQVITGMPHGTKLSDPTAETASRLADGYESADIKDMRRELSRLQSELEKADSNIAAVEAWLIALTPSERFVIEHKLINGEYWAVVVRGYEEALNLPASKSALKRIKYAALDKLARVSGIK